jgi:Asp-tRNA(Asn)/Glu-tRNA(Gln) amidotransferase A subunit family amidase
MAIPPGKYPQLFPTPDQTIAGIGRALREQRTSCVEILNGCLAQVDEWEPKVHAWVVLDRDRALEQARGLDDELKNGKDRGSLHGIPIGIKDIIDVVGLPTACGSKRWADKVAASDATVVAKLREAGAVIMGKTVTTPYAWIDPPVTKNPWNLERTPGGSSSGSAAAVSCGMCFGAIGTQTGGSITRPASFCGVAGMKPGKSFSEFNMKGIYPFSASLDHVGPIARTVGDLRRLFRGMQTFSLKMIAETNAAKKMPPRLFRLRGFFDRRADPAILAMFEEAIRTLTASGSTSVDIAGPLDFENVIKDHRTIMAVEASLVHCQRLAEFPDDYPPRIRELIEEGLSLLNPQHLPIKDRMQVWLGQSPMAPEYLRAQQRRADTVTDLWKSTGEKERPIWITPATVSTATDPSTTGDPAFNSPWSYTGLPTVSVPIGLAPDGLPVAVQLIGWFHGDTELLQAAQWCEQAIRNWRQ